MPFGIDIKYEDDYCVGDRKIDESKPKKEIYQRRRRTDAPTRKNIRKWTDIETAMFYKALQMYGTNMDLIHQKMGKGFTRDDISTKFKYERRTNSNLIAVAMNKRTNVQLNGVLSFTKNPLTTALKSSVTSKSPSTSNISDSDCLNSSYSGSE